MKKIFFAIVLIFVVSAFSACTKHDPFDNYPENNEPDPPVDDEPVWILSCFLQENYIDERGNNFFSYDDIVASGLIDALVEDGEEYSRIPTAGELQMIFPRGDEEGFENRYQHYLPLCFEWFPTNEIVSFKETAYIENKADYSADESGEIISGDSEFCYIENFGGEETYYTTNLALRFKGTSQYAAYKYKIKEKSYDTHEELFLNLQAKWLKEEDTTTTIEDIIDPDYWISDYLELNIPIEYYYDPNMEEPEMSGLLSSTVQQESVLVGVYDWGISGLSMCYPYSKYNLRMIRCGEDGELK